MSEQLAMIIQVAKVITFPLSINKINFDHLKYEPQDNHKVFNNIKLETLNTKNGLTINFTHL